MPTVQVVLIEDVPDLGDIGDVRSVTAGYARNFLLPRRLAMPASAHRLTDRQFQADLEARRQAAARHEAERLVGMMQGATLTLEARVGDQGRMHGQITNQDVAAALEAQVGVNIDRHIIQIDSPIRSLGRYLLPIRVAAGLEASVTLEVVEQQDEPDPAPADADADGGDGAPA